MRTDKFSKTNLILYSCGLIPVIWFGLLVAPYIDGGLVDIIKNLSIAFSNPFNISICEDSLKTVLIVIMAYALVLGIYISNDKNYRRREEHGSAKWGKPDTIKKKYMDKEVSKNKAPKIVATKSADVLEEYFSRKELVKVRQENRLVIKQAAAKRSV